MFRALLDRAWAALPVQCAVCRAWPAQPVCEDCVGRFAQPQPRCRTCALPVPAGVRQCGACLQSPPPLDLCVAALDYAYPWSNCITQFKFHAHPGWASTLATLMRSAPWVEPALEDAELVVPLPLAPQRLRERGYNQSHELARHLAPHKVRSDLLLRIRDTASQSALGRAQRLANVREAFAVEPLQAHSVRGRRIALVDDVMTSGASLYAAAAALRAAGATAVAGIVLARTEGDN